MKGTLTGRCVSCKEHHPKHSMCPPHEVRITGMGWFRVYMDELEAKVEELKTQAREELAKIEALGGAVAAIDYMKSELVKANTARLKTIESGEQIRWYREL